MELIETHLGNTHQDRVIFQRAVVVRDVVLVSASLVIAQSVLLLGPFGDLVAEESGQITLIDSFVEVVKGREQRPMEGAEVLRVAWYDANVHPSRRVQWFFHSRESAIG